jgi:hypothetical protein
MVGAAFTGSVLSDSASERRIIPIAHELPGLSCAAIKIQSFRSQIRRREHHVTEHAVMPSEIEQLRDLAGFLNLAHMVRPLDPQTVAAEIAKWAREWDR